VAVCEAAEVFKVLFSDVAVDDVVVGVAAVIFEGKSTADTLVKDELVSGAAVVEVVAAAAEVGEVLFSSVEVCEAAADNVLVSGVAVAEMLTTAAEIFDVLFTDVAVAVTDEFNQFSKR
jgi:hypothetical protein